MLRAPQSPSLTLRFPEQKEELWFPIPADVKVDEVAEIYLHALYIMHNIMVLLMAQSYEILFNYCLVNVTSSMWGVIFKQ